MSELNANVTQLTLAPPAVIQGSKKSDKIVYSDIVQNGKKGIFVNLKSKTPDHKPTLYSYNTTYMYVYIKYTEELEMVLLSVLKNMDSDSYELLQDKFLIAGVLDKYKAEGFVKAKIDIYKFGPSFFQQLEEGKKGKKGMKNLPHGDFQNDIITNRIYSLKIGGVWRKDNSPDSGFLIRVLAVLVKEIKKHVDEEEEENNKAFKELLQSRIQEDE